MESSEPNLASAVALTYGQSWLCPIIHPHHSKLEWSPIRILPEPIDPSQGCTMAINIESPEVLALIEEISKITGEDAETVVQVAVREQLERLDAKETERLQGRRLQEKMGKKQADEVGD